MKGSRLNTRADDFVQIQYQTHLLFCIGCGFQRTDGRISPDLYLHTKSSLIKAKFTEHRIKDLEPNSVYQFNSFFQFHFNLF